MKKQKKLGSLFCDLNTNKKLLFCRLKCIIYIYIEHGSNNVSRWMTWLPISLKNAAKCDKWYQLQNHSITESLNAKGTWEKLFTSHPRVCRISVSNNKIYLSILTDEKRYKTKKQSLTLVENIQKNHVGVCFLRKLVFF